MFVGSGGRFRSAGAQRERFRIRKMLSDRFRSSLGSMASLGRRQTGAFWGCLRMSWTTLEPLAAPVGLLTDLFGSLFGSLGISLGQVGLLKALLGVYVCVCHGMVWYVMLCCVMVCYVMLRYACMYVCTYVFMYVCACVYGH